MKLPAPPPNPNAAALRRARLAALRARAATDPVPWIFRGLAGPLAHALAEEEREP